MNISVFESEDGTYTLKIDDLWAGFLKSDSRAPSHAKLLLGLIAKGAVHTPGVSLSKNGRLIVGTVGEFADSGDFSLRTQLLGLLDSDA